MSDESLHTFIQNFPFIGLMIKQAEENPLVMRVVQVVAIPVLSALFSAYVVVHDTSQDVESIKSSFTEIRNDIKEMKNKIVDIQIQQASEAAKESVRRGQP